MGSDKKDNLNLPIVKNDEFDLSDFTNIEQYSTSSTSLNTAKLDQPIVISEKTMTRRILNVELIESNHKNPKATVKITIKQQKKGSKDQWIDYENFNQATLKKGQEIQMILTSEETLRIYEELSNLYKVAAQGVFMGSKDIVAGPKENIIVTSHNQASIIKSIIETGNLQQFLNTLAKEPSELITQFSTARIIDERKIVLNEFEKQIEAELWQESDWQKFFYQNKWIFGYGLNYQILDPLTGQPYYGGRTFEGKGDQRGDYLQRSKGDTHFTVLVEIKTPKTKLMAGKYRNGAYQISSELSGAMAQLQANCRSWDRTATYTENESLKNDKTKTVQPKGIMVIGRLNQLSPEETDSFQLFRRNLYNPEVLTFDELLERARYIIDHSSESSVAQFEENFEDLV